jgi:hypothetical protein
MKSALSAAGEGFAIGISAMAFAFILAGFLNVLLEPARDGLAAKQELQGLADPMTYRNLVQEILDGR